MLVVHNADVSEHMLTVVSTPDQFGRTGDINYVIGGGEYAVLGPFGVEGWAQSGDAQRVWLHCDSDSVKVAVVYVD